MTTMALLATAVLQNTIHAHGANSAQLSPDLHYVALTVHGEADCQYLYIVKIPPAAKGAIPVLRRQAEANAGDSDHAPRPKGTVFHRMDVASYLWLPGRAHTLVYGDHAIYGDGVVAEWTGALKPSILARPKESEAQVFVSAYNPATRRLTYKVVYSKKDPNWITKSRTLIVPQG